MGVTVGSGSPMVNNPSRKPGRGVYTVSVGPELEASTARGAMLYDASCIDQPREELFEPGYWRSRDALAEAPGGRGTVAFIHDGEKRWVLRHYRRGGFVARLLDDAYLWTGAGRTRAFAEWRLLRQLAQWRLPVPRAVAARYARSGLLYRAALITEELPTRLTLAQALGRQSLGPDRWRSVGRCIGRLHAHGVRHADLNAHNLLLGEGDDVYVLDFDRGRVVGRGAWERRVLARLRRSLEKVSRGLPPQRFGVEQWSELLKGVAES
ncbi:MAG: 3-deoxy-D-manno-octulosonic acid kinase [Gammaproteobacteria bacterium]|nr:3-deoxy-D-manno-octulosonic acid kinase [Gammaproteobacteria bacterium]